MSYAVGVDLGTTYSAVALCRPGTGARPEAVFLGERSSAIPSVVFVDQHGAPLLGEAAERHALTDPDRVVREFKRRIGDGIPLLVGGVAVHAEELAARFITLLLRQVAEREGGPAARIAVTHPAGWGPHKVASLRSALADEGLGAVELLPEPQAAAVGYIDAERIEPGSVVAIYDLGGGTFDAAVVRKSGDGGFELLGRPEGLEQLGGVDFDEAIFSHVRSAVGSAWEALDPDDVALQSAVAGLRRECTAAKEALSSDTEVRIPVILPGLQTHVLLGRAEFEEMIRPAVAETVDALLRVIDSAGIARDELATVLLVGGSSRIPLVGQLVSAAIGHAAAVDADPKGVIAAGAAIAARGRVAVPSIGPSISPSIGAVPLSTAAGVGGGGESHPTHTRPPTEIVRPSAIRPGAGRPGGRIVGLGIAAAVLAALVLGGGALAEVYRNTGANSEAGATTPSGTVDPVGGPAIESTVPEPTRPPRIAATQSAPPAPAPALAPASPAPPPQTTTSAPTSTVTTTPGGGPEAVAPSSAADPAEEAAREPSDPSAETGG